ncbi:MAG: helix-turn-helix domain-containing protein [Eubacteriales bacterium]
MKRDTRNNGFVVPEDYHTWHEFVYYISCEGTLILDDKQYNITPGRFVTICPHTLHSELHTVDGIVFFCIFQSDATFENAVFDDDSDRTILRLCEAIYAEQRHPDSHSRELQTLMMQQLLLRVDRWNTSRISVRHDLDWAAECIRLNFRDPIRISELAADTGYGYDYFRHCFKKKYSKSPKQYQIECRIEEAKTLLKSYSYSCTDIAYLCGFSNSAQFSLIFKKNCGCSPEKWRRDNAEKPRN